jgi:hypothetical protein
VYAAVITSTALPLVPTPSDSITAFHDLTSPVGSPVAAERSVRTRLAAILALHALGGLDAGAGDYRWFDPQFGWEAEHDHARRVVARVRTAPAEDWLPPREFLLSESAAYTLTADQWRKRAEEYRGRAEFEGHQADELLTWARHFEEVAGGYSDHACRLARWSGGSWQCPRRVACVEAREWMGERNYARREWPE